MSQQDVFDYVMNTPHNTNPAILKQKIKAISGGGVQADWNQSDPSAPDYVHNRTHYVEEEVILEQQVIDGFAEMEGVYGYPSSIQFELSESDEVKVSWDGEIYNCVVTSDNNYLHIGNMFAFGKEDTGEPFVIMQMNEGWVFVSFTDSSTSHEVGITREIVHKLDSKYLPEGNGGGGETMDIVLHYNGSISSLGSNKVEETSKASVTEGSMEAVRTAIKEGRIPKGKAVFEDDAFFNDYGVYGWITEAPLSFYLYGGYIYATCIGCNPLNCYPYIKQFVFNDNGEISDIQSYKVQNINKLNEW